MTEEEEEDWASDNQNVSVTTMSNELDVNHIQTNISVKLRKTKICKMK